MNTIISCAKLYLLVAMQEKPLANTEEISSGLRLINRSSAIYIPITIGNKLFNYQQNKFIP